MILTFYGQSNVFYTIKYIFLNFVWKLSKAIIEYQSNFKYWVMLYIVCSWMTTRLGNRKVTIPMLSQYGAMLILVNGVKAKDL
jgi:hypothetical protein